MRRFFLKLQRRRSLQQDLEAELAFHREMSGQQRNHIPLGNTAAIKEEALDLWRFPFLENLWRDLRYAVRGLRRAPVLVLSALLSLGLGIGVNAAIFSLGVEFLFSEPSVRDAGSLVSIRLGGKSNSPEETIDFLRKSGLFENVTGENMEAFVNYNDGNETRRLFAVYTTKNYFTMLDVPMLAGRGIIPSDPREAVVLSYQFWRKHFGGDVSIISHAINLDGRACVITGILTEHHRTLIGFGFSPDVYLPQWLPSTTLQIYARLKPGMSLGEARAGLDAVAKRMDAAIPTPHWQYAQNISVLPMAGYARFRSEGSMLPVGIFFLVLLIITGLVLLIACVNVAVLLVARSSARSGELAIRLALGAGRSRLIQQFLAESILLALLGAALGLALSQLTATLLARVQLPIPIPIHLQITPDRRVLLYSALLSMVAACICGFLPASQSLKYSITPDLARGRKSRLQNALISAQIAMSVMILATGFLFLRNLVSAHSIDPGFDVQHTLRADVNLPPATYSNSQHKASYIREVLGELEALPGIESAAAARLTPFTDNVAVRIPLKFADHDQTKPAYYKWNAVTPAYFQVMGIPLRRGRMFTATDGSEEKVVIVNETFVKRFLDGRPPIGTVFSWSVGGQASYRIIGVVGGTKTVTIGEEPQPQLYEPLRQIENDRLRIQFVMRSAVPPALQLNPVRRMLHRIDPTTGVETETMYSSIGFAFLPSQVGAVLLGSVGVLGLLLASVGLYGVVAYSVVQRTREIGVRIAVGATRRDIGGLVLRDVGTLILSGSAIGLFIALFFTKPLAMFLVPGLKPSDPLSFGAVLAVMLLTGTVAAWGPVHRALAVDPHAVLRYE